MNRKHDLLRPRKVLDDSVLKIDCINYIPCVPILRTVSVLSNLHAAIRPPTFVFFVNDAKLFPETYHRYMDKQLRSDAGFLGTPIRLLWSNRRKTEKGEGQF
ncbi:hypothetical protein Pyn_35746 [Prunus yedoensis var. nudiflora]|uniref:GTPase Der C-terminal KH-domain-like domain-containing protein n=1 Tax=Prunus yedoensis var. nudiflora TaxID=2094558 RepID=A0A314YNR9_PRUYE|nr:hypothetical protein Pyn_35746 [Prunus yedoensis var. nudiflora]